MGDIGLNEYSEQGPLRTESAYSRPDCNIPLPSKLLLEGVCIQISGYTLVTVCYIGISTLVPGINFCRDNESEHEIRGRRWLS